MSTYHRDPRRDHPSYGKRQIAVVGPCAIDLSTYPIRIATADLCTCGCRKNAHVGPENRGACKPCSLRDAGFRCAKFSIME